MNEDLEMQMGPKTHRRTAARVAGVAAVLAGLAAAPAADAQFIARLALRGEGGVGLMLSQHQTDDLGYDNLSFQGTARLAFTIVDPLVIQLSLANWFFPASNDAAGNARATGRVLAPMIGLRVEPRFGNVGRLFLDGNFGYAFTGSDERFNFDAGLGFEFQLARWLHLGPVIRYGMTFQRSAVDGVPQNFPDDNASYFSAGLSLAIRGPRDEAPVITDRDEDGVMDPNDQCPDTPQGPSPDPARPGCPNSDRDGDGVFDSADQCPDQPQGAHPDPARPGCPVADRDGDGVLDPQDQCPDQPQGATPDPARAGCPAGDRDSDGVLDPEDQCVDVPAGPRPSTARRGCPAPDNDHDNIIDQPEGPDRCPNEPETFNGVTDDDGCPDGAALAQQEGTQIRILQAVNFRTDSDQIVGAVSFRVLDAVGGILRAMGNITIDVQGHTDDRGAADHNRDLSNRRALSVVRYLTEHGIDATRLQGHGFGPDCPAIPGTSRAARAANRRVQFVVVSSETPAGRCVGGAPAAAAPAVGTPAPTTGGSRRRRR